MVLKREARIIGFDDGPFQPHARGSKVPLVAVVMRGGTYVEAILKSEVTVDGRDATQTMEAMLTGSNYLDQIRGILIDGIAFGGFNVVDIFHIARTFELPVLAVTRDEPDLEAMFRALRTHFEDGEDRVAIIKQGELVKFEYGTTSESSGHLTTVPTGAHLWGKFAGTDQLGALEILKLTTVRGSLPEPLRLAHLISTALIRGESKGRA